MIKITQIDVAHGDVRLTVQFSDGTLTRTEIIRFQDLIDKLKVVRELLGRPLKLQDAREALIAIVNEFRAGKRSIPEQFDLASWIGVDLEA